MDVRNPYGALARTRFPASFLFRGRSFGNETFCFGDLEALCNVGERVADDLEVPGLPEDKALNKSASGGTLRPCQRSLNSI